MSNPEQQKGSESTVEVPSVAKERYEQLENGLELATENLESNEKRAEKARAEVLKEAVSVEAGSAEKAAKRPNEGVAARRRGTISKQEKTASFKRHMKQIQAEMPPIQRTFSKFIHSPVVDKASEFVGTSFARPNAMLSGAVVAFLLVLAVYLVAKNLGYVLSGFETIGAFFVGWILGILYDYFRVLITGKK